MLVRSDLTTRRTYAPGISCTAQRRPRQNITRGELYDFLRPGELLQTPLPAAYKRACEAASAETFDHVEQAPGSEVF